MATPINNSVLKAFSVLDCIKNFPEGATLSDIAGKTGISIPTTHRFLRTLLTVGAVEQVSGGAYVIGDTIRQIGIRGNPHTDLKEVLTSHVQQLSRLLNETIHVAILSNDMIRYIAKAESSRSLKIVTREGTELEAYCTGVGKVLLAHLPEHRLKKYLDNGGFVRLTENTIVEPTALREAFLNIRKNGFSFDDGEFETGLNCIAVPIILSDTVVASLSISGPSARIPQKSITRFYDELRRRSELIAREISSNARIEQAMFELAF